MASPPPTSATPETPRLYSERFDLIDAFRGLAALAVVVHHTMGVLDERLAIAHIAVLVFFVISGYCIASAADACQRKGLTFKEFMWRRLRRIYPPYLFSLLFWAATRVVKWKLDGVNDLAHPATHWVQNVTLTQWFTLIRHPENFASQNQTLFVTAYWSLNYEEQFYLVFALMLLLAAAMRVSVRVMVAALIGVGLVWTALFPMICYGFFLEYWPMFGVGALVFYRLCRLKSMLWRRLTEAAIVGMLLLSVAMRTWGPWGEHRVNSFMDWVEPQYRVGWGDLAIASAFALLLLILRPADGWYKKMRWLSAPLGALGMITYSLYLVHQFNLKFVETIQVKVFGLLHIHDPSIALIGVARISMHICIGAVFWYFCERPFLNKSLLPAAGGATEKPAPART